MDENIKVPNINFPKLMDLRVDYAFKTFAQGNPNSLISLLNAIFANKKISRVITSITIVNPNMDKKSDEDKLSILDVKAKLSDGTFILIELHMYGLGELKPKTIRSWARTHGEDLEEGQSYITQPPTIAITFANGAVEPLEADKTDKPKKIHRLCMIMDVEENTIFTNAMELHYINMKAFAEAVNTANSININETEEAKFAYWLSIITEKEINNKAIIENAYVQEEEIRMAVTALQMQSEDKLIRQAYQRRRDEIYFHKKEIADNVRIAEEANRRNEQLMRESEQLSHKIEQANRKIEQEARRAEQEAHRAEQATRETEQVKAEMEILRKRLAELEKK
jgi:predicted transposase/invertase (TIGR01784 family)